uniref:Uncharacterized protein n=1 Tax=Chenopodium quinoa TaxID=63459 RepID=A0A803MIJ0_CHEQI
MEKQENSSTTSPLLRTLLNEETKEEGIQIERNINESEHDQLINYDGSNKKIYHHLGKKDFREEAKRQVWLAGPLILVGLLTFSLHIISLMMVGHLGELPLSAASMATSFAYVTGFSALLGMASALETVCGQSYGAEQYNMVGIHIQRAIVLLMLISIPINEICSYTETILVTLGQDHEIAAGVALYTWFMILSLFAYSLLQCFIRFFQTQNIVIPMMLTSGVTTLCHILICWLLVYKFGLGIKGAALANTISYWIICLLLALYVKFSSACSRTWTSSFSKASFQGIPALLRLAIPSAVMVCLNTTSLVWVVPEGFSGAVSTRVSNELKLGIQKQQD